MLASALAPRILAPVFGSTTHTSTSTENPTWLHLLALSLVQPCFAAQVAGYRPQKVSLNVLLVFAIASSSSEPLSQPAQGATRRGYFL